MLRLQPKSEYEYNLVMLKNRTDQCTNHKYYRNLLVSEVDRIIGYCVYREHERNSIIYDVYPVERLLEDMRNGC